MASGIAETLGGEKAKEEAEKEFKQKLPKISEEMKSMISDIRKDLYEQMEQKRKEIEPFISDPIFDAGPEIIEKYDFGIPKLSQELDDSTLAQYTYLLLSEDAAFGELFSALGDWMNSLPQFPDKKTVGN
jgi:F0F1-type ATP synthase membrane subunit b/b'